MSVGTTPHQQEDVYFYCDGLRLAATVHVPPARVEGTRHPAVVVCNGFGAGKDLVVPEIADVLAQAGFVALRFDYRGFGSSEGPPFRLIPQEQVEDARAAVTYLQSRDDVDPSAVVVYGTSFGGAHAVSLAGTDDRVKGVVAVVPVGDGTRWLRSLRRNWEWNEFLDRLEQDRTRRVCTGESEWVDSDEIMVPDPHSDAWHQEVIRQFPERKYSLPLETADRILSYSPESVVGNISPRPLLLIAVAKDALVPTEQATRLYDGAGDPKRLLLLEGIHHHDVYSGRPFETVLTEASNWLRNAVGLGATPDMQGHDA